MLPLECHFKPLIQLGSAKNKNAISCKYIVDERSEREHILTIVNLNQKDQNS